MKININNNYNYIPNFIKIHSNVLYTSSCINRDQKNMCKKNSSTNTNYGKNNIIILINYFSFYYIIFLLDYFRKLNFYFFYLNIYFYQ